FVQFEKKGVNNVGAEENVERGYELKAQNDETLDKISDNQDKIDASREWLLEDRAGVSPRMFHFDMDSATRRDVDNSLRTIRNLKQLKHETFNRLSQPWTFGTYPY
ncbi:unnamed protein product, partial [Adineta steineri]